MRKKTPAANAYRSAQTDPAKLIDENQIAKAMLGQSVIELEECRVELENLYGWAYQFAGVNDAPAEVLGALSERRLPGTPGGIPLPVTAINIADAVEAPRAERTLSQQVACDSIAQQLERQIVEIVPFNGLENQYEALRFQASGREFQLLKLCGDWTPSRVPSKGWMFDSTALYRILPLSADCGAK